MLPMVSGSCRTRCPDRGPRRRTCRPRRCARPLEIFDNRQPNGTDGFTLLTVFQPQATRLGARLRPFQADHLASSGAGQRKLAFNADDRGVFLLFGGFGSIWPKIRYSASESRRFRRSSFGLPGSMGGVALDDPRLDGVGRTAEETDRACRGSSAASDDSLSAQLLGLTETRVFPAMMPLRTL